MITTVQTISVVVVLAFLTVIVRLVRARKLRAKYSFFWLVLGVGILALAAVPGLLKWITDAADVHYPPSLLFASAIMLLLFVSVHFSWELSRLEERTRTLAEEIALLTEELRSTTATQPRAANQVEAAPQAETEDRGEER